MTGKSVYIPCHTVGYQMHFFRLTETYLCILQGVHLIGCASYSLQQICASYTVCILHCVHHRQLLSRSDSAAINASVQCRGATRCISTPSVHHHLRSRHPSNTSEGRIEHDALYICVWCSEYSSICRATWCISAWYLDTISASAAVPGGASPNHDQTPLIGLMHLISSPQHLWGWETYLQQMLYTISSSFWGQLLIMSNLVWCEHVSALLMSF